MLSAHADDSAIEGETFLELIMRFSPAVIAMSLAFATVSSATFGQSADIEIRQRSVQLMEQGEKAQNKGNFELATDLYETALAVDPSTEQIVA